MTDTWDSDSARGQAQIRQRRDAQITERHRTGVKYPAIGREFHLTAARICQILKREALNALRESA